MIVQRSTDVLFHLFIQVYENNYRKLNYTPEAFVTMPSFNPNAPNGVSTNGNNVTSTTLAEPDNSFAVRAKQASTAWHNLEDAWKGVSQHSSVFLQIAEAMDRHDTMQVTTQKKDKNIAELESAMQVQIDQHEKRYTKWEQEKSQLEHRITDVRTDLSAQAQGMLKKQKATHIQEIEKLKKELEAERRTVATLKEEMEKARTRKEKAEEQLRYCTKQVSEWDGYLSLLKDVDLKKLYVNCCSCVRLFANC